MSEIEPHGVETPLRSRGFSAAKDARDDVPSGGPETVSAHSVNPCAGLVGARYFRDGHRTRDIV